jgi:hypothetical protein
VRSRKSVSARTAAQKAFVNHCGGDLIRAAYGLTGETPNAATLYKPTAWPHILNLEVWLRDSNLTMLSRDSSVLEGHLCALVAECQPQELVEGAAPSSGLLNEGYSLGSVVYALTGLSHHTSRQVILPQPQTSPGEWNIDMA